MKKDPLLLLFSFLLCAFAISLELTPAQAQTPGPDIGAFLPLEDLNNPSPWNFAQFQTNTQHDLDVFLWYQAIGEEFNSEFYLQAAENGSTIQLAWLPWDSGAPDLVNQPAYKLTNITNGNFDADIHRWATQIKDFGYPVLFRPMGEMNGNWTSWSCGNAVAGVAPVNGNSPADYVAAYRHVHDIFVTDGVTNVEWVWAPNRDGAANGAQGTDVAQYTFNTYYPGDSYVDYIGIDGYNWGNEFSWSNWQDLSQIFGPSYDVFVHSTVNSLPKPKIMIAEMSSTENGAPAGTSKASWMTAAYSSWFPYRFPEVENVTWFNQKKPEGANGGSPIIDWRITSTTSSQNAFNGAMQSLYDRSSFMNFFDNSGGDDWIMAANPSPVNNAPVSTNLFISGGLQNENLWPTSTIAKNTVRYAYITGLSPRGPIQLKNHQLDTINHTSTKSVFSQRTLWPKGGNSLEEVLSRNYETLSDHYYWPWYDQQSPGMQDYLVLANLNPFEVFYEIKLPEVTPCSTSGSCGTIPPNGHVAPSFPNKIGGPVEVKTYVSDPIGSPPSNQKRLAPAYSVPSQRVLSSNNTDFTEFHGIPAEELSNHYVWTWYDYLSPGVNNWIMIANPGSSAVTYSIKIAGIPQGCPAGGCTISAGGYVTPSFPGLRNGPVEVTASGNVIASQRILWGANFDEVPGLPYSSLKSQYFWTWYDMFNYLKNIDMVMIANPNSSTVYYKIKLAGIQLPLPSGSGTIPQGGVIYPTFPGRRDGPLEVVACYTDSDPCSSPANVITSQRVLWKGDTGNTAFFNEVWGTSTN